MLTQLCADTASIFALTFPKTCILPHFVADKHITSNMSPDVENTPTIHGEQCHPVVKEGENGVYL